MANRPLSGKQTAFVHWYTTPGETLYNGTRSAGKAGYAGTDKALSVVAHRNLGNPRIQRAIHQRVTASLNIADLTIESVIGKLEQHRLQALQTHNINAANKALEMQGRYLKMFVDRVEHVHTVEDATDDELVALLNELLGKMDGDDLASITGLLGGGRPSEGSSGDTAGTPTTH